MEQTTEQSQEQPTRLRDFLIIQEECLSAIRAIFFPTDGNKLVYLVNRLMLHLEEVPQVKTPKLSEDYKKIITVDFPSEVFKVHLDGTPISKKEYFDRLIPLYEEINKAPIPVFLNPNDPLIEIWGPLKQEFLNTAEPYALAYLNGGYPVFPNHLKDIQNEQRAVNISLEPVKEILQTPAIPSQFDYSNKANYFFPDKIEGFKNIEIELLQRRFVNDKGVWIKEDNKLVALIHILYNLHYLKASLSGKRDRSLLNNYKRFFQSRYSIDISKSFQPSQFKISSLSIFKADFHFIPEIDKI